ncbi:RelA/SpoT family protein [Spiroplasma endosymbiont of Anurida maritima]
MFPKDKLEEIRKAYEYAEKQHRGQKRKSGQDFIIHPLWTAYFLAQWRMGTKTIIAGILHDVLEDTPSTMEDITQLFDAEIASLVDGVTKVSYFAKENRTNIKSQYLRKLYLSMAKDIRVIIIKLADRIHNLSTINFLKEEKQKIIAKESLEIYSSIAHRIGMKNATRIIQDRSFEILMPEESKKIHYLLEQSNDSLKKIIENKIDEIKELLTIENNLDVIINGRDKSTYSIYYKMNVVGKDFYDIHDILAIRIITKTIDDCYRVLGLIHQKYTPLSNRFKDFIATPKNNLYQSLHTTLASEDGAIFEVQIRTEEMHEIAEEGVAAHWKYKEGENYDVAEKQKHIDERLNIFKSILDFEKLTDNDIKDIDANSEGKGMDVNEWEKMVKHDLFSSLVYALTPVGNVITLPYGATVLDFAYKIHSEIGEKTIGAKVNGSFSSLSTVLKSGDIIDVKTSSTQTPNISWLKIAKTTSALQKIKRFLKKVNESDDDTIRIQNLEKIKYAKTKIDEHIKKHNLKWKLLPVEEQINRVNEINYHDLDTFLLDVANNEFTPEEAVNLIYLDNTSNQNEKIIQKIQEKQHIKSKLKDDIIVQGATGIKATISQCCMPIPFENIIGYVSKTEGIKVHLWTCVNIQNENILERKVDVEWNEEVCKDKTYECALAIKAFDRPGLLVDLTKSLNHLRISIVNINGKVIYSNEDLKINIIIKVSNIDRLKQVMNALTSIPDIKYVERAIM